MDKQTRDHIFEHLVPEKKITHAYNSPNITALRQTHQSILKESIEELARVIPEQLKMKITGCKNPIETEYMKVHPCLPSIEEYGFTNVLFEFDFDSRNLDEDELRKLSTKIRVHFNNDPNCPVYIQNEDRKNSHHTVYIRNVEKFKKAKEMYDHQKLLLEHSSKKSNAQITSMKRISLLREGTRENVIIPRLEF